MSYVDKVKDRNGDVADIHDKRIIEVSAEDAGKVLVAKADGSFELKPQIKTMVFPMKYDYNTAPLYLKVYTGEEYLAEFGINLMDYLQIVTISAGSNILTLKNLETTEIFIQAIHNDDWPYEAMEFRGELLRPAAAIQTVTKTLDDSGLGWNGFALSSSEFDAREFMATSHSLHIAFEIRNDVLISGTFTLADLRVTHLDSK